MKGLKLAFASVACVFAFAIGNVGVVHAATRRATTNESARQTTQSTRPGAARTTTTTRTATSRSGGTTNARTSTNIKSRSIASTTRGTVARTSHTANARTTTTRQSGVARAITARAATTTPPTREGIMNRQYSKCREVYNSCMDEFCANKDTQLRRCACSGRATEFDSTKKQLSKLEDKMQTFNQRLLAVGMDSADVVAMNTSTVGEDAYNSTKDKSASKKQLDAIAKRLNTSFDSSNFDNGVGLSALSWSLNEDAAFDNIDSLSGASTTAKSGTALYSAALPICREMAQEVCTEDELAIAESAYPALIEQDCNTVHKAFQTQTDTARQKVHEGSALLDMARLDAYQTKNSDDILTCKNKMLDMMYDSTVCGENLGKCLDVSGQYIDPSTGAAFLSVNLANLDKLITRPTANQTWTRAPGNELFVSFLESKKKFLEPATKNCQDIADYVWDAFIEDALAQIKLAQGKKLEEMRQSCTTLTTQCLSDASQSIADFDARALSTFGVMADLTVNAMCTSVRNACTALLNDSDSATQWDSGMTQIATEKTYDAIMHACREIGRACVIQACTSVSGNFGLCVDAEESTNRKAIIDRTACWNEVYDCVASAGATNVERIMTQLGKTNTGIMPDYSFYNELYSNCTLSQNNQYSCGAGTVQDMRQHDSDDDAMRQYTANLAAYRIAESIWGNCTYLFGKNMGNNHIVAPVSNQSTILSWLATNTGEDSCTSNRCMDYQEFVGGACSNMTLISYNSSLGTFNYNPQSNENPDCPSARCCTTGRMTPTYTGGDYIPRECCDANKIVPTGSTSVCCPTGRIISPSNINDNTDANDDNIITNNVCIPSSNPTVTLVASGISYSGCPLPTPNADVLCFGEYTWDADTGTAECNGTYVYRCQANGDIFAATTGTVNGTYYEPRYHCDHLIDSLGGNVIVNNPKCNLEYTILQP